MIGPFASSPVLASTSCTFYLLWSAPVQAANGVIPAAGLSLTIRLLPQGQRFRNDQLTNMALNTGLRGLRRDEIRAHFGTSVRGPLLAVRQRRWLLQIPISWNGSRPSYAVTNRRIIRASLASTVRLATAYMMN